METPKPFTGPYRATRLWNEAIRIFNNGMPRKRHWRQLRQYENCFTAAEAISWLHSQLKTNPHFGPTVTKVQTQQLLCKFLKAGVFEDVRGGTADIEHFKDNSGLYRLTNRSPFRNPRTPGRTPLGSLSNHCNNSEAFGSPKLTHIKKEQSKNDCCKPPSPKPILSRGNSLVQCQLTSKQLNHQEVEEIWKNTTLREVAKSLGLSNLTSLLDVNKIQGKWVLWNVTHVGVRGVVQPMEETDSPPSWVLYGMKSLVNWPSNENHKLPEYQGSEKDVFKVICDYFTNSSSPLSTFTLYNVLVEAFVRSEAADLVFRKSKEKVSEDDGNLSVDSHDSVQSLVLKMSSPISRFTSTPFALQHHGKQQQLRQYQQQSLPVMKSPLLCNRSRSSRITADQRNSQSSLQQFSRNLVQENVRSSAQHSEFTKSISKECSVSVVRRLHQVPSNKCYETAFTTAEPTTRVLSQDYPSLSRRSYSSDQILSNAIDSYSHGTHKESTSSPYMYYSLDRLRSKSGGYINVAAFDSMDCLEQATEEKHYVVNHATHNSTVIHSQSISRLGTHRTIVTGLSPSSSSETSITTVNNLHDYENFRLIPLIESPGLFGELRVYRNSPSKRLIGRRKGLEFYYGAKACKPGLITPEGKSMTVELLQLITLLLPPDRRRKLHLILQFMAKTSANGKLVLDPEINIKTLMINTFYRCIVCSSEEAEYDELTAVRLVTFLMENVEAIMTVPHKLCTEVRDLLLDMQREKIRFQLDDVVPLAYCQQVSQQRFEEQRKNESENAIRQLLEHITSDQNMTLKEKRKRLKQFQIAYPEIYSSKFQFMNAEAFKGNEHTQTQSTVFARIRNLRLS